MTLRGHDAVDKIRSKYGGVQPLCERLHTDPVTGQFHSSLVTASFLGLLPVSSIITSMARNADDAVKKLLTVLGFLRSKSRNIRNGGFRPLG